MKDFKYRVKLTPGVGKKGKACKQAIEMFCSNGQTSVEKNLMKGLSDPEMVAIMIGDVKLSAPGLYAAAKKK